MAEGRRRDAQFAERRLRGAAHREHAHGSEVREQGFENVEVRLPEGRLGGAVGKRSRLAVGVPGEGIPQQGSGDGSSQRAPHHTAGGLQPEGRVAAGGMERRAGRPGQTAAVVAGELALAGEGDAGEASAPEPERLADQHHARPADPLQIRLEIRPPDPRRAGAIERRIRVAVRIHHSGRGAARAAVEKADERRQGRKHWKQTLGRKAIIRSSRQAYRHRNRLSTTSMTMRSTTASSRRTSRRSRATSRTSERPSCTARSLDSRMS